MTASVLSNWTQKMNIENQTVDWSHCAKSWRSFFIPKIKKGGQAQWQNLNPLTNSELILASGWNSPQWFFWRTLTPKRNELRRNLHRNSTSWNVWKTEKSFWNRSYRPQFRQKWKRSRSPVGPRRLGTATRISASLFRRLSAFFESTPGQDPKAAKFAVLNPGHAGFPKRVERSEGSNSAPIRNAPCFAVWAVVCDFSPRAECVHAFTRESKRGPLVREIEKRDEERLGTALWR